MVIMKTVSVTDFKAHCLEMLNEVSQTGQPVLLTKQGKPTAMVVPPPTAPLTKFELGRFRDSAKIVGDLISPSSEPWEALD